MQCDPVYMVLLSPFNPSLTSVPKYSIPLIGLWKLRKLVVLLNLVTDGIVYMFTFQKRELIYDFIIEFITCCIKGVT